MLLFKVVMVATAIVGAYVIVGTIAEALGYWNAADAMEELNADDDEWFE